MDGDVGNYLRATASYADGHGTGKSAQAVSANPVEDAPTPPPPPPPPPPGNTPPAFPTVEQGRRSVAENSAAGVSIGAPVTALDPQGDSLTYSLSGRDADLFDINAATGQLVTKAPLDYESKASYGVIVWVQDGRDSDGNAHNETDASKYVTITVTDVNEPPLVTGSAMLVYTENGVDAVASYMAVDPEGGVVDWSLAGDDSGVFSLSATGTLAFDTPPDYETPEDADVDNRYRLTVQASDTAGTLGALEVEVVITDDEDESIIRHYDSDRNSIIDRPEALAAAFDYFEDLITNEEVLEVISYYFAAGA